MPNSIIKNAGFHHIALRAKDYDASCDFYTKALGFTVRRAWGEGDKRASMLDMGNGNLVELFAGASEQAPAGGQFFHLAIATSDTDSAYAAAIAGGAKPDKPPYNANIGGDYPIRIAFVFGPDGESVEFFQEL